MKVYTGTGDKGKTSLFSGERIAKDNIRIEAYGTIDELNSLIGGIAAALPAGEPSLKINEDLLYIQAELFSLGAWLATTPNSSTVAHLTPWTLEHSKKLEKLIDTMQAELEELRFFVLPGGHQSAAWAHIARTVCRRAERRIVGLKDELKEADENYNNIERYINRLSDYLFVLARYCNHVSGTPENFWEG
ncbi:MAG: cob(I)yrinic acid a,c-diamide adenosyltransferase [Bacteroidetes bacterium]|nr:cob(I)yrinic acid a,c-diamide adenosyltransferase [Bacteroidota bacterium]